MILSYRYYPGCTAKGLAKQVDLAMYAVCARLGIDLNEMEAAACCGAGNIQESSPELAMRLNARTLAEAGSAGGDIVTLCNTCLLYLRRANAELQAEPSLLAHANDALAPFGLRYDGTTDVKHIFWVLIGHRAELQLEERTVQKLTGLRLAPFYGCHILRPSNIIGKDEAEDPDSLERLIRICGADVAVHDRHLKCCGFHTILTDSSTSLSMIEALVQSAKGAGADAIVTPCPLCLTALDLYQSRAVSKSEQLPVIHILQMVGLSMMLQNTELGLDKHLITATELRDNVRPAQRLFEGESSETQQAEVSANFGKEDRSDEQINA